ncbi:MAG: hypothetical protein WC683_02470 [bacterium]
MRANDAQVLQVWTAAWSWKDAAEPCEYVFARTESECLGLLGRRLHKAKNVLVRLKIVRNGKLASTYLKDAKPRVVDIFDPELRDFAKDLLPDFNRAGAAVRSSDEYADLVECADLSLGDL